MATNDPKKDKDAQLPRTQLDVPQDEAPASRESDLDTRPAVVSKGSSAAEKVYTSDRVTKSDIADAYRQSSSGQGETKFSPPDSDAVNIDDPATAADIEARKLGLPQDGVVSSVYRGGTSAVVISSGVVTSDHDARHALMEKYPSEGVSGLEKDRVYEASVPVTGDPAKAAVIGSESARRTDVREAATERLEAQSKPPASRGN